VTFRNQTAPEKSISHLHAPSDRQLWKTLEHDCPDLENGCDVRAILLSMNTSNGRISSLHSPGAWTRPAKADLARLRVRLEPIVEIMLHQGDSECRNGLPDVQAGVNELCNLEKMEDAIF
jgi:hypothetical protein